VREGQGLSQGWTLAIQTIGAIAGLGLLATFVGGSMLWLRFDALDLPADRAVALLPKEVLVVVGAHALVVPVLIGLLAVLALVVLDPKIEEEEVGKMGGQVLLLLLNFAIGVALIVALTVGVDTASVFVVTLILLLASFLAYQLGRPRLPANSSWSSIQALLIYFALVTASIAVIVFWDHFSLSANVTLFPEVVAAVGVGIMAVYLLVLVLRKTDRLAYFTLTVFAVFAVLGGLSAVAKTSWKPRMEPLAVLLKDDERGIAGYFVGETSDRLYFVELPGNGDAGDPLADAPVDRVTSVERSKVLRATMREPVGVDSDEAGRELANSLLQDLRLWASPASREPVAVTTANPEVAFAPLVHLHSEEDILPMDAQDFVDNSVLGWSGGGEDCERVRIATGTALGGTGANAIDSAKLGATADDPYVYGPDERCLASGERYLTKEHTRPFDKKRGDGNDKKQIKASPKLKALADEQGFFLDVSRSARKGLVRPEKPAQQTIVDDVPVYVEGRETDLENGDREFVSRLEGEEIDKGMRLTYWLFYGLSRPPDVPEGDVLVHEGDWERISVLLAHLGPADSSRYVPISVTYHHHNEERVLPWYAVRRVFGGDATAAEPTHPEVYVAKGSHASYWRIGRYKTEYKPSGTPLIAVDDDAIACSACPQWRTWDSVLNVLDQGWYGYGGAWGDVGGSGDVSGPLGPSIYKIKDVGTPTTEIVSEETPVPSAPPEVRDLVSGESGD
jgi:hypothetical protein